MYQSLRTVSRFVRIGSYSSSSLLTTVGEYLSLFLYSHLEGLKSKIIYIIFNIFY